MAEPTDPAPASGVSPHVHAARGWRKPWTWVPSLYFAEGIPLMVVATLSTILYKRLGLTNAELALYTSWLYLPWVIKPFWAPLVEMIKTKRFWILAMQILIGGGLAGVALTIPAAGWVQGTLAFFWLLAFSSATHDIAADGFYMLDLDDHEQAWWVGWRSTAYRLATLAVSGLVPILAGALEAGTGLGALEARVEAVAPSGTGTPEASGADGAAPLALDSTALAPTPRTAEREAGREGLALTLVQEEVQLPIVQRSPEEAAAVLDAAREANRAAGFYEVREAEAEEPGPLGRAWSTYVSGPLGRWIGATFGEDPPEAAAVAGNVAVIPFRLSGPPPAGEEVVVNFGQDDGDKSINLVEGERFVFTESNWDRPFLAAVQLDPKLETPTAATFRATSGNIPLAWSISFFVLAGVFLAVAAWHFVALPRPASDVPQKPGENAGASVLQYLGFLLVFTPVLLVLLVPMMLQGIFAPRTTGPWGRIFRSLPFAGSPFAETITTFFEKREIGIAVAFVLLYRFAEGQVVKLVNPFLLDSVEVGGLALTTGEVGFVYGTVGVASLTVGGIVGGLVAARDGLGRWLWPMVAAINLPNAMYLLLAWFQPEGLVPVLGAVAVEQFGYGFGFAAFLLVLIYIAEGEHKTAHYAIGTGFMALGIMIPGLFSGWLQELLGYERFFIWVLLATIPSFLVTARIRVDPDFGKKKEEPAAA